MFGHVQPLLSAGGSAVTSLSSPWARRSACCTRGWRPSRWAAGRRWRSPPPAETWPTTTTHPGQTTLAWRKQKARPRRVDASSHLQFDFQSRLVELQLGLEAERVKLLGDDQRSLNTNRLKVEPTDDVLMNWNHLKVLTSLVRFPATFCSFSCCE